MNQNKFSCAQVMADTVHQITLLHIDRQKHGAKIDDLVDGLRIADERLSSDPGSSLQDLPIECLSQIADALASAAEIYRDHHQDMHREDPARKNGLIVAADLFEAASALMENETWLHWRGLILNEIGNHQHAADAFAKAQKACGDGGIYHLFAAQSVHDSASQNKPGEIGAQNLDQVLDVIRANVKSITGMDISDADLMAMAQANGLLEEQFDEDTKEVEHTINLSLQQSLDIARAGVEAAFLLIDGRYQEIHDRFSASFKRNMTLDVMRSEYEKMISYSETPLHNTYAMAPYLIDGLAHVYVAINSQDLSEAITFVVSFADEKRLEIEEIEWGRP